MSPCKAYVRTETALSDNYKSIRKMFTVAYENWNASGQNNPDVFWNFCDGKKVLLSRRIWHGLERSPSVGYGETEFSYMISPLRV